WEQHLNDAQRCRLALYRLVAAEDEALEATFFVEYSANREGGDFLDALDEAGDDPVARAEAFYQLCIDSYPFWLSEECNADEDPA
ncbi:MAG: hypothetical protein AVDCRST_MAG93-8932, partial [uncultured Chloroflexia bacterium]